MWNWVNLDGTNYLGVGTNLKYYIEYGGGYYDITPIRKTVSPMLGAVPPSTGNPLSTAYSTLNGGITATATSLILASGTSFTNSPGIIKIDSEQIYYTAKSTNTLTGLVRGYNGTTAATHATSAAVGCSTITVTDVSNGAVTNDFVTFSGLTAIGGFTTGQLNVEQQVFNSVSTDKYTFNVSGVFSTSAVTAGGGTVGIAAYQINTGLDIYVTGSGWGAGVWGRGGWGSASSTQQVGAQLRLWSNDNYGQDLIIAPRNGGIYYWKSSTGLGTRAVSLQSLANTTTSLTDASTFSAGATAIGVTVGGTGYVSATYTAVPLTYVSGATMTSYPTATVVVAGGIVTSVTPTGGNSGTGATTTGTVLTTANTNLGGSGSGFTATITAIAGTTTITATAGSAPYIYPLMYITGSGIAAGTQVSSSYITGSTSVSVTTAPTASSSGNYSYSYSGSFVPNKTLEASASSIQRFVIAFGANPYQTGVPNTDFNPMLVRWCDQGNQYEWVPDPTNQAGEFGLSHGSSIVTYANTRQEILIWTDSALYSMQYVGAPYVWSFQLLMDNISIMSPNSVYTVNNVTYWMGNGKFYQYSGRVDTLPCSLRQYLFNDINQNQSYQVFSGGNEGYNEVWWFYCSLTSDAIDKYIIYNYLDKVWYYGTMARTAWLDSGIREYPMATDYNKRVLYHESDVNDNAGSGPLPINSYVQSSDFDIGDGHNFGFVWRILPDVNFNGSNINQPFVTMTVKPRQNSGTPYGSANIPVVQSADNYVSRNSYNIQEFDGQVYTRLRGRQMSFRIESTELGVAWQLGAPRIDIRPDGKR
jgi:hypothetical protein